jgi:hypothetical protein
VACGTKHLDKAQPCQSADLISQHTPRQPTVTSFIFLPRSILCRYSQCLKIIFCSNLLHRIASIFCRNSSCSTSTVHPCPKTFKYLVSFNVNVWNVQLRHLILFISLASQQLELKALSQSTSRAKHLSSNSLPDLRLLALHRYLHPVDFRVCNYWTWFHLQRHTCP